LRIASVVSLIAIVLSGLAAPSATPAAPELAVPSTIYLTCEALICDDPNRSASWIGTNSFETAPGSYAGGVGPPPADLTNRSPGPAAAPPNDIFGSFETEITFGPVKPLKRSSSSRFASARPRRSST
jgi:hypothetical protein